MGGEDAVEEEIDAGPRGQGGELFQEFEGLEEEGAGAVGPLVRGRQVRVLRLQAVTLDEPPHAGADRGEQPGRPRRAFAPPN
jgi:hypothetical protein